MRSTIGTFRPRGVLFARDEPRESLLRTALFPEYKGSRERDPVIRKTVRSLVDGLLESGAPIVSAKGYEADDVIASAADILADVYGQVVIASQDKDLGQLVSARVRLFKAKGLLDVAAVTKLWGVQPKQVPEVQALCGDKADDIPGLRGVGPKTAAKIIVRFGSIQRAMTHAEEWLTPAMTEGKGFKWKRNLELTSLVRSLDLPISLASIEKGFNWSRFAKLTRR
jgi:DNA polymerase-1